jgi:hypothetical protein
MITELVDGWWMVSGWLVDGWWMAGGWLVDGFFPIFQHFSSI